MLIDSVVTYVDKKKHCVQKVEAVCIDVRYRRSSGSNSHAVYDPVLEYEWMGERYVVTCDGMGNRNPDIIGLNCWLMIDPDNPKKYHRTGAIKELLTIIFAFSWTGLSFLMLLICLLE